MNKHYQRILLVTGAFLLTFISVNKSSSQIVDPNFRSLISKSDFALVYDSAVQADGKVVIGGLFENANGYRQAGLARLLPNGKTDETFQPVAFSNGSYSGIVSAIKIQPDNKIVIAGSFSSVNGQSRRGIVRLNENGSLDATFAAVSFNSTNTGVGDVEILPDGKILIAGSFLIGSNRSLARLNGNGSVDSSFQNSLPADNGGSNEVEIQADGRILINYYRYENGNNKTKLIRLNANGSADNSFPLIEIVGTGFTGGGSPDVDALVLQPDGKILLGGSLSSIGGIAKSRLARLNADGSIDNSFTAASDAAVQSMLLQPDGRILIGGGFTQINGVVKRNLARLNADGTLDASLSAAFQMPNITIYSISRQTDGKIIVGGEFMKIGSQLRYRIARLNNDGALDDSFEFVYLATPGLVSSLALRNDGKIMIAGQFSNIEASSRRQIALINSSGTLDESFGDTGFGDNSGVRILLVLPDDKVMATGSTVAPGIIRFNRDGTIDTTLPPIFTTGVSGYIGEMKLQSDGKMLVGGNFTQLDNSVRNCVARINANGTLDTTFQNNTFNSGASVSKIIVQPDGKVIIAGNFTQINGQTRNRIARLNADGTLDAAFQNGLSGVTNSSAFQPGIYDLYLQNDGKIIIAGSFEVVNGTARKNLARINADGSLDAAFIADAAGVSIGSAVVTVIVRQNGKILVGGNFSSINGQTQNGFAQLNTDGSPDTAFPISIRSPNNGVYSLALEPNGNVIVGGNFGLVNSLSTASLFRIIYSGNKNLFDFDGDGKADISVFRPDNGSWYIQQSQAGFTGLAFGLANDKLVPGDYDGDGKTDVAVYRSGNWYLQRSSLGFTGIQFGDSNDIPVPADYDGDGRAELAVFRPSNGYWYLLNITTNQFIATQFGISTDKPVPADYDGDGKADIAVNRSGNWYIQRSQLGFTGILFGDANDKLIPADYDGDGKTDIAVFRPSNGVWYLQQSSAGFAGIQFGLGTDTPVAADYDGDGKADLAVVRNGNWYLRRSAAGLTGVPFGTSTDRPIPNAFIR